MVVQQLNIFVSHLSLWICYEGVWMVGPSHPTSFQPYHSPWCCYGTELSLFSKFSCLILLRTINGTVLEFSEYLNSWHCFFDETSHEYVLESVSCVCFFNPKLVKKVRLILLVPEGILFLLESWKGSVWGGSSQHRSTELCGTDYMRFTWKGVALSFTFPGPNPAWGSVLFKSSPSHSRVWSIRGKHWGLGELIWC